MPKYVFEQNVILPAGDELPGHEALVISAALAVKLKAMVEALNHPRCETKFEPSFEHVYGPNAESIDLEHASPHVEP